MSLILCMLGGGTPYLLPSRFASLVDEGQNEGSAYEGIAFGS